MDDFTRSLLSGGKSREETPQSVGVKCQQCGAPMEKTKKVDKSLALQLLGVVLFLIGVGLLFVFPIGTVGGVILMVGASRVGYKKVKIWKCERCGYFFERAN